MSPPRTGGTGGLRSLSAMLTRTPWLAALAAALAIALAACGTTAPFAARVDGRTISQDTLESELRAIASNEPYLAAIEERLPVRGLGQGTFDAAFTAQVLSRQILYSLVDAEVGRRGLAVADRDLVAARPSVIEQIGGEDLFADFPESYQRLLVRRAAEINVLTVSLLGSASPDEAARSLYAAEPDSFATACVRHVLVPTAEAAAAVKARIDGGEDFAAVARAESQDTLTAAEGGSLGCDITRDTGFVPEFLAAVFSQPVDQVGDPVRTSFGFHVIQVTRRGVPAYDDAASAAQARVVASGQSELRSWIEAAVEQADVDVDPKYGSYRKAGVNSVVVPPQAPSTQPAGAPVPGPAG